MKSNLLNAKLTGFTNGQSMTFRIREAVLSTNPPDLVMFSPDAPPPVGYMSLYGTFDTDPGRAMTPAEQLACAVLEGDADAALALADEVTMTYVHKREYVSSRDLADALRLVLRTIDNHSEGRYITPSLIVDAEMLLDTYDRQEENR